MSNPVIPKRANPLKFKFGTTHRTEDGFEFAIIAKSECELCRAWGMIAGPVPFDPNKVSKVKISKGETK